MTKLVFYTLLFLQRELNTTSIKHIFKANGYTVIIQYTIHIQNTTFVIIGFISLRTTNNWYSLGIRIK